MNFADTHRQALRDLLRWRRDVRHFRTDPVAEGDLAQMSEAMDFAPSVGNARPWRVIRVRSATLRAQIRDEFTACNAAAAAGYDDATRADYLRLKLAGLEAAPEHLAVFTETAPQQGRKLGRRTMPETLEQSTAMAIHSLWLTARALNLGVGMVSILRPERVTQIFDVPGSWRFSAYLCIGHPEFTDDTPLLHRADWQKNTPTTWEDR